MQASGKGGSSSTPVSDDWFPRPEKGTDALSYVRRMRLSPFHPFHHVRRRGPPMIGPQHAGEEAILPEVARPPAARVVILRVPPMNAPATESPTNPRTPGRPPGVRDCSSGASPAGACAYRTGFAQHAQVRRAVLVQRERLAAVHSPLCDVTGQAGQNAAAATWHTQEQYADGHRSLRRKLCSSGCPCFPPVTTGCFTALTQ